MLLLTYDANFRRSASSGLKNHILALKVSIGLRNILVPNGGRLFLEPMLILTYDANVRRSATLGLKKNMLIMTYMYTIVYYIHTYWSR